MRGSAVASRSSRARITAEARVPRNCRRYLGWERNDRSPGPALSSVAILRISAPGSPISSPPSRDFTEPVSARVGLRHELLARAGIFERLDDLVGDIDAGARPHDLFVLKHDVEALGLGDPLHREVRALDDFGELLVAPLCQVLVEFALLALEIPVELAEFPLALLPVGFRHRHRIPVHVFLQLLQLLRHFRYVLPALGELLLQFLLRPLGGRRLAQDPLQADKSDLRLGESRTAGPEQRREDPDGGRFSFQFALPPKPASKNAIIPGRQNM